MRTPRTTSLLSAIATAARATRTRFTPPPAHFDQVTPTYAEVWFPTGGCLWDSLGHCTTCNYGAPAPVHPDAMVQAVEIAVAKLAPTTETLWVSAFDTLQEREVPAEVRRRIFELLGTTPARTVVTETHPASVRAGSVAECVDLLGDRTLGIELGVETMDEFVRYTCVNKPFTNATLLRAVNTVHECGAQAWANLIVGIPFLDRREVVDGTVRSVRDAADFGFDQIVLFPNHVKEHTIAYLMAAASRYLPPDLWVMRDVLAGIPHDLIDRVHLAWVDIKPHPGAAQVAFEPDPAATETLRRLLERFNLHRERAALHEAVALPVPERRTAEASGDMVDLGDLVERLLSQYRWLADNYGEQAWWAAHGAEVRAELEAASGLRYREPEPITSTT